MNRLIDRAFSRKTHLFAGLLLAGLVMGTVPCAALPDSTLSLETAVKLALAQNPDLQAAQNRFSSSEIAWKKQRNSFLPDLSLSSSGSRQAGKSVDPVSGDYTASAYTRFSINLSSSLTLFNGFANTSTLHQTVANRNAAAADLARARQGIVYSVAQEFIQSLIARSFISVEKENRQAQAELLEQISAFYQAGRRPVADLYQQQAEIAASEYRLEEADRAYQVAVMNLLLTLGMDPDQALRPEEPQVEAIMKRLETLIGETANEADPDTRPDIAAQKNRVLAARHMLRVARSGRYPRLSASAGVGSSYSSSIPESNLEDQLLDRNLSASVSLNLSLPVFDRGQTSLEVAAAKIQVENENLNLRQQQLQAAAEIRQARLNWENASRQLASAQKQLTFARAALNSMQDRYRANAATLTEVSQSRSQYRQASYNHAAARYTRLLRGLEILFSNGDEYNLLKLVSESSLDAVVPPALKGEEE